MREGEITERLTSLPLLGRGKEAQAARYAAVAVNPHALDRNPGMTWLEQ